MPGTGLTWWSAVGLIRDVCNHWRLDAAWFHRHMDCQWHRPAALQEWMVQQASELLARRDSVLPDYFGLVLEAWTVEELQRRTVIDLGLPHGDGTRTAEPSAAPPPQAEPPTACGRSGRSLRYAKWFVCGCDASLFWVGRWRKEPR